MLSSHAPTERCDESTPARVVAWQTARSVTAATRANTSRSSRSWPGSVWAPTGSPRPATAPRRRFLALGVHTPLSLYLAAMTAVAVFRDRPRLQPGHRAVSIWRRGYKVATRLLGDHAGLDLRQRACRRLRAHHRDFSRKRGRRAVFRWLPPSIGAMKLGLDVSPYDRAALSQPARDEGVDPVPVA